MNTEDLKKKTRNNKFILRKAPMLLAFDIINSSFLFILVLGILTFLLYFFKPDVFQDEANANLLLFLIYAIGLVIFIIGLIIRIFLWTNKFYVINKDTIAFHEGIIFSKRKMYSLEETRIVTLRQNALGKILNYGTVMIFNPIINQDIVLKDILNPRLIADILQAAENTKNPSRDIIPMRTL